MNATDELILMPEVQARLVLRGRRLRFAVLAPVGTWLGCGALRVLRASSDADGETISLVCGYESYEPQVAPRAAAP